CSLTGNRSINYCGKTSIENLMGILSKCKAVITNEGGLLHMAAGLGVKTVSIFGPVDEATYGPYPGTGSHAIVSKKGLPCRPCYQRFKYKLCDDRVCLNGINVEDVLSAVDIILASVGDLSTKANTVA
ncbi:MAG: glycosyltransferase family 9 protein, partial [Candidatus Omnitrophota bacterium]|nr:glycosyltransferase family 9 protein [Candidatus Omnitrophota bacterium]